MSKMTSRDYQALLEQAGDEAEQEVLQAEEQALLDERLNLLGPDAGEAEQAAALADAPRLRGDGQVVGMDTPRRPLTPQQIAFAQGVVEGKSRRQAYRDAYPNAKGADATISACAHRLSKDPRIARMIEAGWEETTEALAEDVAAQRRYVSRSLVALSKAGKQEGTRLRALELLGRAAGMFKEQQQQADKPVTAEELRKELAGHLRLVGGARRADQRRVNAEGGDSV